MVNVKCDYCEKKAEHLKISKNKKDVYVCNEHKYKIMKGGYKLK